MRVRQWIERISFATLSLGVALAPSLAWATGAGGTLPWDTSLQTITTDLTGPVAYGITIAGIVLGGLGWAHGEHGSGIRKISATGFGGAAALGAVQALPIVFPFASALL
jgi:type IV secretion system protein TrbC